MRLGETEFLIRYDPAEWNAKKLDFSSAHHVGYRDWLDHAVHGCSEPVCNGQDPAQATSVFCDSIEQGMARCTER